MRITHSNALPKLRHYRTNLTNTPARRPHTNWADELLGMDTPERPAHGVGLQEEVQAYLTERPYTLGSVRYWEV